MEGLQRADGQIPCALGEALLIGQSCLATESSGRDGIDGRYIK